MTAGFNINFMKKKVAKEVRRERVGWERGRAMVCDNI